MEPEYVQEYKAKCNNVIKMLEAVKKYRMMNESVKGWQDLYAYRDTDTGARLEATKELLAERSQDFEILDQERNGWLKMSREEKMECLIASLAALPIEQKNDFWEFGDLTPAEQKERSICHVQGAGRKLNKKIELVCKDIRKLKEDIRAIEWSLELEAAEMEEAGRASKLEVALAELDDSDQETDKWVCNGAL